MKFKILLTSVFSLACFHASGEVNYNSVSEFHASLKIGHELHKTIDTKNFLDFYEKKITHVSSSSEVIYQLLAENHQFLCGANFIKMFFLLTIF